MSDRTKGPEGASSASYRSVEWISAFLDRADELGDAWSRELIATGQMNADGSSNRIKSVDEVYQDHRMTINRVQGMISVLESQKDFLPEGHNESAEYVKSFTKLVDFAKANLESTSVYATKHNGLVGQLFTKDSDGSYQMGAFVLTTLSTEGVLQTGSNGNTQIATGKDGFTAYIPPSVNSPAKPPLDIRA